MYKGWSLRFARQVHGDPAADSYPDCNRAIEALNPDPNGLPPVGSYVWFRNARSGDVGTSLGNQQMLCIGPGGTPVIEPIRDGWHGAYVGHTPSLRVEGRTPQ